MSKEFIHLKLPLLVHQLHMCDIVFKDIYTFRIKNISLEGDVYAECTGCGISWEGNYKMHWIPKKVGLALMQLRPDIKLKLFRIGCGYIF